MSSKSFILSYAVSDADYNYSHGATVVLGVTDESEAKEKFWQNVDYLELGGKDVEAIRVVKVEATKLI